MKPKYTDPVVEKLIKAVPTFMNQCSGGPCGDRLPPDKFECASYDAMKAIEGVFFSDYHYSQIKAIFEALRAEMASYERCMP